jgi:ppGpp synthetase/RelA/SpoT-type nucleotidyltranferase
MAGAAVLSTDQISDFVNKFREERSKYIAVKDELGLLCAKILLQKDVKFHWEARVKDPDSLDVKLRRRQNEYDSDDANCKAIKDLVAGRIIIPRWSNFSKVEDMIKENFDIVSTTQHPKAPWKKKDTMQQRFRDYDGYHFYFKRKPKCVTDGLHEVKIEIQVMSPFMWAYQDLQHDVEYKELSGTPSQEESTALEYLRGIANMGEVAIQHFEDAASARQRAESGSSTSTRTASHMTSDTSIDPKFTLTGESLKSLARSLESLKSLQDFLDDEKSRRAAENKGNIISWVSSKNVEFDHYTVRDKLGKHYHNSGQWFKTHYDDWILSPDISTLWVTGSVGTGKSSLM